MLAILALVYALTYTQAFLKGYGTGAVIMVCAFSAAISWIAATGAPHVMLPGMLIFMVITRSTSTTSSDCAFQRRSPAVG